LARSGKGILDEVKRQVKTACLGIAQSVHSQQTDTGVKDTYTQSWIERLIARARTLQQEGPQRTSSDIQTELLLWVDQNEADLYNPCLTLDGKFSTQTNQVTFELIYGDRI